MARLLLIAGASCSGKTELARRLQQMLPEPWLFWEADRMQPLFPRVDALVDDVTDEQMLQGNLRSIRAYVDAGFNVVAELWIWHPDDLAAASEVFAGIEVGIIRLECDPQVLETRETERGTTFIGTARAQHDSMPQSIRADLVLDSGSLSTDDLSHRVAEWLKKGEAGLGPG